LLLKKYIHLFEFGGENFVTNAYFDLEASIAFGRYTNRGIADTLSSCDTSITQQTFNILAFLWTTPVGSQPSLCSFEVLKCISTTPKVIHSYVINMSVETH
jgi:hypothetical protein